MLSLEKVVNLTRLYGVTKLTSDFQMMDPNLDVFDCEVGINSFRFLAENIVFYNKFCKVGK